MLYYDDNGAHSGELPNLTEVSQLKFPNAEKTSFVGSRSFKVIEFGTNQKGICNFLVVVNSNVLLEIRRLTGQKLASETCPCLI